MNLADIARTVISPTLTRNQLKALRAKLRRANVTNLDPSLSGPYAVTPVYASTRNANRDIIIAVLVA